MFSHFFIRRPIFAAVIAIVIVLLGGFAMLGLPIERFPNIAPPAITVAQLPASIACEARAMLWSPDEQNRLIVIPLTR